jgi:hypothetical protein
MARAMASPRCLSNAAARRLPGFVVVHAALVGFGQRRPVAVQRLEDPALLLVTLVDVAQVLLKHRQRDAAAGGLDLADDQEAVIAGEAVGAGQRIGPGADLDQRGDRIGFVDRTQQIACLADRIHRVVRLAREQLSKFKHRATPARLCQRL